MSTWCARYVRRAKVEQVKQLRHARQQGSKAQQGLFPRLHVNHVMIVSRHAGPSEAGTLAETMSVPKQGPFVLVARYVRPH